MQGEHIALIIIAILNAVIWGYNCRDRWPVRLISDPIYGYLQHRREKAEEARLWELRAPLIAALEEAKAMHNADVAARKEFGPDGRYRWWEDDRPDAPWRDPYYGWEEEQAAEREAERQRVANIGVEHTTQHQPPRLRHH